VNHAKCAAAACTGTLATGTCKRRPMTSAISRNATPSSATAWFTMFAGLDAPASSAWTREVLGWMPGEGRLLEEMDSECYFPG
jgi:hypothetical protein